MNKKQKTTIVIAIVLLLLNILFPPLKSNISRNGDNIRKDIGYCFIFLRPTGEDIIKKVFDESVAEKFDIKMINKFQIIQSSITYPRLFIQMVTILLITIGFCLLFTKTKK